MLGAGDLRVAMNLPSRQVDEHEESEFTDVVNRLVEVSQRHKMPLAAVTFRSSETAMWLRDFQLLFTTADFLCVVRGQQQDLARIKGALAKMGGLKN
jgi:hypothetical protein